MLSRGGAIFKGIQNNYTGLMRRRRSQPKIIYFETLATPKIQILLLTFNRKKYIYIFNLDITTEIYKSRKRDFDIKGKIN